MQSLLVLTMFRICFNQTEILTSFVFSTNLTVSELGHCDNHVYIVLLCGRVIVIYFILFYF